MLFVVGVAALSFAGIDSLRLVECNIGHKGPNDTEYQFGVAAFCDPETQGCVSAAEDTDGDGRVDDVTNVCLPRRTA